MINGEETMVLFKHEPRKHWFKPSIARFSLQAPIRSRLCRCIPALTHLGVSGPRLLTKTGTVQITDSRAYINDCCKDLNSLTDQHGLSAGAAHDDKCTTSHLKTSQFSIIFFCEASIRRSSY